MKCDKKLCVVFIKADIYQSCASKYTQASKEPLDHVGKWPV